MVKFTEQMIAACGAALDAGVFYEDAFEKFVVDHMGGYDCKAVFIKKLVLTREMNFMKEARPLVVGFEKEIAALPRGSYGLVERPMADDRIIFDTVVSDGTGENAVGGSFDHYYEEPAGTRILERMVGYEIYLCRKHVQKIRDAKVDNEAVSAYSLCAGRVFKGFSMPGDNYSTATITDVYGDGQVKAVLVKRGSRRRWALTARAVNFIQYAGLEKQPEGGLDGREKQFAS